MLVPATCLAVAASSCSQLIDPNVPEPIRPFTEPQFGREYLLYRPSAYDRQKYWPLLVVCHANHLDSPVRQIREWTQLSEKYGFLVIAPHLEPVPAGWPGDEPKRVAVLLSNARQILSSIRHVQAGHSISGDRILIYGWSDGAETALFTALRHPDVFRAASVIQPRFAADALPGEWRNVDASLPIHVRYDVSDAVTGKRSEKCVQWLRIVHADVAEDRSGPARRSDTAQSIDFFQRILRTQSRSQNAGKASNAGQQ